MQVIDNFLVIFYLIGKGSAVTGHLRFQRFDKLYFKRSEIYAAIEAGQEPAETQDLTQAA